MRRRSALAQSLALKSAQPRYEAFLARAPSRIAAAARERAGTARADALKLWERATALAGSARRHSLDPAERGLRAGGHAGGAGGGRRSGTRLEPIRIVL